MVGEINLISDTGLSINLKNVLYSSEFRENLLSVSQIVDTGLKVVVQRSHAVIMRNEEVIAKAKRCGNLFEVKMVCEHTSAAKLSKTEESALWHKRPLFAGHRHLLGRPGQS